MKQAILILLICISAKLYASEVYELYNGSRPLGMGDAFLTLSDDENAHFYNPAGISAIRTLRGARYTIFNPYFGFDKNLYSSSKGILLGGMQSMTDYIQDNIGKHYHMRTGMFPNLTVRNMSFGVMTQINVDAETPGEFSLENPTDPIVMVNTTYDVVPTFTISFPIYGGVFRLGGSTKMIWRAQFNEEIPYSQIEGLSFAESLNEGIAFAGDVGAMFTVPIQYFPKFSIVLRNIGGTKFYKTRGIISDDPPGAPNSIPQTIDAGIGFFVFVARSITMNFALDYRDMLNAYNSSWVQKLHTGIEFNIGKGKIPFLQLRGGLNQCRWTVGFSVNSAYNSFEILSYGEEIGSSFWDKEDRRYVLKYSIGF